MSTAKVGRMGLLFWATKVFGGSAVDRVTNFVSQFVTENAWPLLAAAVLAPLLWYFYSEVKAGTTAVSAQKKKSAERNFAPARGKLFASSVSTCSRKVIMALEETGGEYAFQNIDLAKKEQMAPEYLKIQPFGKVPVWQEDDFRLFESRAILKHVSEGSALYPGKYKCARTTALIDQWVSIEYSYFQAAWTPIFVEKILKKRVSPNHTPDEVLCATKVKELTATLDLMAHQVEAKGGYLTGRAFTLADLTFVPYLALFPQAGLSAALEERPALAKWAAACLARPAWKDYAATNQVLNRPVHGY